MKKDFLGLGKSMGSAHALWKHMEREGHSLTYRVTIFTGAYVLGVAGTFKLFEYLFPK